MSLRPQLSDPRFDQWDTETLSAAATAAAALRLATKAGSTALAERIRKRLSEYEQQSAVERR